MFPNKKIYKKPAISTEDKQKKIDNLKHKHNIQDGYSAILN